ncbi:MAG TPA: hypothetical protein VI685_18540 [Candidatus Angelobacter sp.]
MRQFTSISALIGLLISGHGPVRVTACHQVARAAVCHRAVAVHHCDMPMNQDDEETASTVDLQPSLGAAAPKCPMNCCATSCSSVTIILPARTHVVSLHELSEKPHFAGIMLESGFLWSPPGRGPPSI